MDKTIQVNLRLPNELVDDLNLIAKNLKVNRNDWLKVRIAESVREAINSARMGIVLNADDEYIRGVITEKDYVLRKRIEPTNDMKVRREEYKKLKKLLGKNSQQYVKNYFDFAKDEIAKINKKKG